MCECSPGVASFSSTAAVTEDQKDRHNDQRPAGEHTQHHQKQDVVLLRTRHQRHVLLHAHACQSEISVMLHTSVHFTENFLFFCFLCISSSVLVRRQKITETSQNTQGTACQRAFFVLHHSLFFVQHNGQLLLFLIVFYT